MLRQAQRDFATSKEPFPAFVGGFGSGKTAAAIARAMALKAHFKECDIAYYLPTYPLVEDIAFRRFPDLCERKGWEFKINKTSQSIEFPGAGRIVFRTMERPERIVGYEVAHSICDELDTLPVDKARDVWNKVIARNRQKCMMANTVGVATTPEGFRFVYERWVKNPMPGYVIYRAKTMDNAEHLPAGYVENLQNTYSSQMLQAYLEGEFVNLTAGTVYCDFNRAHHGSSEVIEAGDVLHIGCDFNVTKQAAVVFVMRGNVAHAVDELVEMYDTPAMIQTIKSKYPGMTVCIYPDASGGSRKSVNASQSDIGLLKQANFKVRAPSRNPPVKDRILSVNKAFKVGEVRVNVRRCPSLSEALEQQAYDKNGEPDKSTGFDHILDAAGYMIHFKYPIVAKKATSQVFKL